MKHFLLAAASALALASCDQQQKSQTQANTPAAEATQTYSGTGNVTAIAGDQVSIAHGPIQGIGWPAMTMTFTAPPDIAPNVKVGAKVDFSFRKEGSAYVLTSVKPH